MKGMRVSTGPAGDPSVPPSHGLLRQPPVVCCPLLPCLGSLAWVQLDVEVAAVGSVYEHWADRLLGVLRVILMHEYLLPSPPQRVCRYGNSWSVWGQRQPRGHADPMYRLMGVCQSKCK